MSTYIPAQPGFFALERVNDVVYPHPVIAWLVKETGGKTYVWAVGIGGEFAATTPIVGPDGKRVAPV